MRLFILPIVLTCLSVPALAAPCTNPPGDAGDQVYNTTYNVMQYCNGSHWVAMGSIAGQGDNLGSHTAQQAIDMAGFRIEGLAAPVAPSDAATKQYADTKVSKAGDTMTGTLSVPAPTANAHATTKQYVDTVVASASSGGTAATCQVICNGTCPTAPSGWTLRQSTGESGGQSSGSAAGRCTRTASGYLYGGTELMCCYFK